MLTSQPIPVILAPNQLRCEALNNNNSTLILETLQVEKGKTVINCIYYYMNISTHQLTRFSRKADVAIIAVYAKHVSSGNNTPASILAQKKSFTDLSSQSSQNFNRQCHPTR